jgi:pilus assembly protein CpaF
MNSSQALAPRDGHVLVNIRKFTGVAFTRLAELVARDMFDDTVSRLLKACVRSGLCVLISGPRGRERPRCCPASPRSWNHT